MALSSQTSSVEAVIFDCDGVLIDSERIANQVLAEMLDEQGWSIGFEEVVRRFKGLNDEDTLRAIEVAMGRALPAGFNEAQQRETLRRFEHDLQAVPGIRPVLEGLRLPRCVASSSHPTRLLPSLRLTGLDRFFAPHIYSASQVARGKPFPDLFLFAAAKLGVSAEHCIVIEDSVAGARAGVQAGMRVLGYADLTPASTLGAAGATVFDSMNALPRLLCEMGVRDHTWFD